MKADRGTPCGLSCSGSMEGHWLMGAVKRALACAAVRPEPGVQSWPVQSIRWAGGCLVSPSHHTSPLSVRATLVKMAFSRMEAIALGLDFSEVPGATPKKP